MAADKSETAFRTIGEVSAELGVSQHVLRYWETRFPQLRPVTRAGNRRYYRPADVALARRIGSLLSEQGYTVKGVQKLLADGGDGAIVPLTLAPPQPEPIADSEPSEGARAMLAELIAIRDTLAAALAEDAAAA